MKKAVFILLFLVLMFSSLFGLPWNVANAQGTIPEIPPESPTSIPVTPVKAGTTVSMNISDTSGGVVLNINSVAKVSFTDMPTTGSVVTMTVLNTDAIKPVKPLTYLTEVFEITIDTGFQGKASIGVYLTDSEIALLKNDASYGLYRFDEQKQEWVRVIAKLEGNFLVAETEVPGIFVVGKFE